MKRLIALLFVVMILGATVVSSAFAGKHVQQCWHGSSGNAAGQYYFCP
jgi:hypothetical protein